MVKLNFRTIASQPFLDAPWSFPLPSLISRINIPKPRTEQERFAKVIRRSYKSITKHIDVVKEFLNNSKLRVAHKLVDINSNRGTQGIRHFPKSSPRESVPVHCPARRNEIKNKKRREEKRRKKEKEKSVSHGSEQPDGSVSKNK